jgi:hypothetical protein
VNRYDVNGTLSAGYFLFVQTENFLPGCYHHFIRFLHLVNDRSVPSINIHFFYSGLLHPSSSRIPNRVKILTNISVYYSCFKKLFFLFFICFLLCQIKKMLNEQCRKRQKKIDDIIGN